MKAAVIIPLQVILLFLLPEMDGAFLRMDKGVQVRDEDNAGNARNQSSRMPKPVGICYDTSPYMKAGARVIGKKKKPKTQGGRSMKTCYKNIEIIFTPECSNLQFTDFSNMEISNFCIGERVYFSGSIYFYVGMSMPSTMTISFSRTLPHDGGHTPRKHSVKYHYPDDSPTCMVDACDVLGLLRCPEHRMWCDCPIKRENLLLDSGILMEQDFIPDDFGTGKMYAHMTLNSPEDEVCLNFAFERVKQLNVE